MIEGIDSISSQGFTTMVAYPGYICLNDTKSVLEDEESSETEERTPLFQIRVQEERETIRISVGCWIFRRRSLHVQKELSLKLPHLIDRINDEIKRCLSEVGKRLDVEFELNKAKCKDLIKFT